MVRSHLDYCSSVWTPYRKGDIEDLEKAQKGQLDYYLNSKDLNIVIDWKHVSYLHYTIDVYEEIWSKTFKIVSGKYDSCAAPNLTGLHSDVTREHDLRLEKFRARYDLRKYFLQIEWLITGTLCRVMLVHADTVNSFRSRLDNFWKTQDVLYDYHAEIHGTGSRSEVSSKFLL